MKNIDQDFIAKVIVWGFVLFLLRKLIWGGLKKILVTLFLKFGKINWAMRLQFPKKTVKQKRSQKMRKPSKDQSSHHSRMRYSIQVHSEKASGWSSF